MNSDDSRRRTDPDAETDAATALSGADLRQVEVGLRDALAADARSIQPSERLDAILSEAHEAGPVGGQHPSGQQRWSILAAAAAVALVAGGTLWLAGRADSPTPPPAGTPSATVTTTAPSPSVTTQPAPPSTSAPVIPVPPSTSPGTTAPAGSIEGVPVYWIGDTGGAPRLFREFRTVPDTGGPVDSAVTAMTAMQPLDPDYTSPWRPASRVDVTRQGDGLTVDLSADAISGTDVGSELAQRAVQQLVYTATAAAQVAGAPARTVTILVDGKPADAWGVVRLGEPTARAPQAEVQSHVWVLAPTEGQQLPAGPVQFTGFGTSFEANFLWQITRHDGSVVAKGNAMGGTGTGGFGEFAFERTLPAGQYVITMSTEDPSGGAEGGGPHVDTKSFTVG